MRSGLARLTAQAPVPYAPKGRTGPSLLNALASQGGMDSYMRTMGVNGTVFGVVSLIATAVAKPEWRLYRKQPRDGRVRYTTDDQGSDQRTEVVQHQALKVWTRPNDFMTQTRLTAACQQHQELTGEQYQIVEYAGTIPVGLWPARPDRMFPVPSRTEFLAGWMYKGPDGQEIPFRTSEVLQTVFPNPLDPYRGLGPVQSVLVDIDASRYSAEWNRSFFLNGADPGGVLTAPNEVGEGEFDDLIDRWRESHQGINRAHKVALLENGVTWQQAQFSQRDMEFGQLRTLSRDFIMQAWGIHKHMLGIADDVNRANAITAEEIFQDQKVSPRLDLIKDMLNHQFLPLFGATGAGVEFDYINPRPVNREADALELQAKAQAALWLRQAGYDPASVCEVVGLPDMAVAEPPAVPSGGAGKPVTSPTQPEVELAALARRALLNARRGVL